MTVYRSVRRRPVRKARRPAPRRQGRIHKGWATATVVGISYISFRAWPAPTIAFLSLAIVGIATAATLFVVRPAWVSVQAGRVARARVNVRKSLPQRSALPRQLTAEAFHRLSPGRFEQAIAELAWDDDTMQATVVGGSGDGGADVLVKRNDGTNVLIQCKRYKKGNNVPSRDIRDANGAYWDLHRCHRAVIVTTADFTKDAKATNARLRQQVRLVNGAALVAWARGVGPSPLQ